VQSRKRQGNYNRGTVKIWTHLGVREENNFVCPECGSKARLIEPRQKDSDLFFDLLLFGALASFVFDWTNSTNWLECCECGKVFERPKFID